jgi:uncharacterized protein (TIGR02246 family)
MPLNQPNQISPDEAVIRGLIENWARAVREQNLPAILASHAPQILMFDVPPPFLSRGIEAYRKTWDFFFKESDYAGVFEIDHLEVTAGRDVAFATALMHCGTPDKQGPDGQLAFRLTVGLQKIDGQWTILHEHHSIPAT